MRKETGKKGNRRTKKQKDKSPKEYEKKEVRRKRRSWQTGCDEKQFKRNRRS